jgi:hypothetical protein
MRPGEVPAATKGWSLGHIYLAMGAAVTAVSLLAGGVYFVTASLIDKPAARSSAGAVRNAKSVKLGLGSQEVEPSPVPTAAAAVPSPAQTQPGPPPGFTVSCSPGRVSPGESGNGEHACQIASQGGFSQVVALQCVGAPRGLRCELLPSKVTPPPNGEAPFTLRLSNDDVAPGKYGFRVTGTAGGVSSSYKFSFDTTYRGGGLVVAACDDLGDNFTMIPGETRQFQCSFGSGEGFIGTVSTSCEPPPGMTCDVTPKQVAPLPPIPNDPRFARVTLTVSVSPDYTQFGFQHVELKGFSPQADPQYLPAHFPLTVKVLEDFKIFSLEMGFPLRMAQDSTIVWPVQFYSVGYSGPVYVTAASLDAGGPQISISPATFSTTAGANVDLRLTITSDHSQTMPGPYRIAVSVSRYPDGAATPGTPGFNPAHYAVVTVTVNEPTPPA